LREIYDEMHRRGLTRSERAFSRDWLCRSSNHLADTGGEISVETAMRLYVRLTIARQSDLAAAVWADIIARIQGGSEPPRAML
jgi:hypothetical protein